MINKFNSFIKINEEYSFNVGDRVEILPITAEYIRYYGWPDEMYNTIGKVGTITVLENEHDKDAYYIEFEDSPDDWYYFEDCIQSTNEIPNTNIKWYKKGKLVKDKINKDHKINELFGSNKSMKNIIKDLKSLKLKYEYGSNIEVFFISDIKGFGKKKEEAIRNKLLNKRILFYYSFDMGDSVQTREEIMTVDRIDFQGLDLLSWKNPILLEGTPEFSKMTSIYLDPSYPLAILPAVERKYIDNIDIDPFGEEIWY